MANDSAVYAVLNDVHKFYADVHPWLGGFLCVCGVFMNVACVIVLTRPSMISNLINCLLTVVAICDAATMLSYFNYLIRVLTFPDCLSKYTYEWIVTLLFHSNLSVVCHSASIWLTVAMAVVRVHTIRSSVPSNRKSAKAATTAFAFSLAVFIMAALLNLPSALSFTVATVPSKNLCLGASAGNSSFVYNAAISELGVRNNGTLLKIAFWINGMVFKMAPCVLLTLFIILLIFVLAGVRRRRKRLHLASESQRSDRTTLMLIVLLTVFLISELPQGLLLVGTGIFDRQFRFKVYNKLGNLMDLLSLINSAANFVIYFVMSQKFRQVFCRTLFSERIYRMMFRDRATSILSATEALPLRTPNGTARNSIRPSVCYSQLEGIH